jgi:serine protease Do
LSSFVATPVLPARETRPREWVIGLGSALVAAVVTVLVLVAFGALGGRHRAPFPPAVVTTPTDIVDYTVAERVAAAVAPSVVTVRIVTDSAQAIAPVGSGVVVRSDRVITNAHLLMGATKIDVVTQSGTVVTAELVGTDPQTDLALLKVADGHLSWAPLGSSNGVRVGQAVVAVAAANLSRYRIGINVVSSLDLMTDTGTGVPVAGLIETGIPTNPQMAGGALIDTNGNVIGVLTYPVSGPANGLAVPVNVLRDVEDQLDSSGKVNHGWIGVVYGDDAGDRAQGGALIQSVFPNSPATGAGLQPGDVITRAGGDSVTGRADAIAAVRRLRPQDPLDLTFYRDGHEKEARVTVTAPNPLLLATAGMG